MNKNAIYFGIAIVVAITLFAFLSNSNNQPALIGYAFTLDQRGQLPGEFIGKATAFDIQRSLYRNVSVTFDKKTQAHIQSITGMVGMRITPSNDTLGVTISNLEPNTKYYKYVDHLDNLQEITADEAGSVTFQQDASQERYIMIFTSPSTYFIEDNATGGDCKDIGSWNTSTKTCTLNKDTTKSIEIKDNGITLDGDNHTVQGPDSNIGIYINGGLLGDITDVTIKDITVIGFSKGIQINNANNVNLINVITSNNADGTEFYRAENSSITDSSITSNTSKGLIIGTSSDVNGVTNNIITSNGVGIDLGLNSQSLISRNNITLNGNGITVSAIGGANTFLWQNNLDNANQVSILFDGDTQFYKDPPIRGNFWADHACTQDTINNNICTNRYLVKDRSILSDIYDEYPWACEDGWKFGVNCPVTPPQTITPTSTATTSNLPGANSVIENARSILDAPYQWGAKGFDYASSKFVSANIIKNGNYQFWNIEKIGASGKKGAMDTGLGIDCSGLSMWSYNKDQYGDQKVNFANCLDPNRECRVFFEGANKQYKDNSDRITKNDLKPGDLLFFDTKNDGVAIMDHMALYTGESAYNVIHASGYTNYVTYANYDPVTNELTTINKDGVAQRLKVTDFGRLKRPKISLLIYVKSPVTMIITDPNGLVTSLENPWDGGLEYQVHDVDNDGELNELAATGERKMGEYKIKLVPIAGVASTDTYSLIAKAFINGAWRDVTLAQDVPVSKISKTPYILQSSSTEIVQKEQEAKTIICHVPPGNPTNAHTLSLPASAIQAHLGHGDKLGECSDMVPPGQAKKKNK